MKRAIEDGLEYSDVTVTRVGPDANNGFTWTITFVNPVPTLSVATDGLRTSSSFCCSGPDPASDSTDFRSWEPLGDGFYNSWDKWVSGSTKTAYAWQDKCEHGNCPSTIYGASNGGHCSVPDVEFCEANHAEPSLPNRPPTNSKQGAVEGKQRRCPYGYPM